MPVTRDGVRAGALRLFAEHGYRSTTMADIGAVVGIRGPSLYKHVTSKQELLAEIIGETMTTLITQQRAAVAAGGPHVLRLRRAVEAHVRYHATHRDQAFVGNRELDNLEEPFRTEVLSQRRTYQHGLRGIIEEGCAAAEFSASDPRLVSFAILDMGIGVATWFRRDGDVDVNTLAYCYADLATQMVGARHDYRA